MHMLWAGMSTQFTDEGYADTRFVYGFCNWEFIGSDWRIEALVSKTTAIQQRSETIFFWTLFIILIFNRIWCFGSRLCFCFQVKWKEAPNLTDHLGEAALRLYASSHFTCRQKQSQLPKCHIPLKTRMMDKVQKKKTVSVNCVPLSEPYRLKFNIVVFSSIYQRL
jgi:hypothetical protein